MEKIERELLQEQISRARSEILKYPEGMEGDKMCIRDRWNTTEHNLFAWKSLMFLCFFCIFIALAKMTIDMAIAEKPFSKTLSACLWCCLLYTSRCV